MSGDQLKIVETCTRMAWHTDHREWDLLTQVFADKVMLDYRSLNGGEPVELTPEQVVAGWSDALGGFDATHHLLTNHLVQVSGDTATCTASFQATHRLATVLGSPLWTLGGTYRFDLVRRDDTWKISAVVMTAVWADGNKDLSTLAAARSPAG